MAGQIKVTLKGSVINSTKEQRKIIAALGFKKTGRTRLLPDNAAMRGAIKKMEHLLEWEEA